MSVSDTAMTRLSGQLSRTAIVGEIFLFNQEFARPATHAGAKYTASLYVNSW